MEENNKDNDFVVAEAKQDFDVVETINNFEINKVNSQNIASSLKEKAVAKLVGTFTATTTGTKTLTAVFKYEEGSEESVKTETEVIAVKLEISLVSPDPFPASLPKNFTQEVVFLVKNETEFEATQINLEEMEGLVGVNIIEEKPNNGGYEKVREITVKEFNEIKLDAKHQFRIQGKLKTDQEGSKTLKILVKYHELEYLDQADQDKLGAKFEQAIDIQAIKIVGEVTKLPAKIKLGSTHPVVFQFTNQNDKFAATGVNITITAKETPVFSKQELSELN